MFENAKNKIATNIIPGKKEGTSATGLKDTLLSVLDDTREAIADLEFGVLGSITPTQELTVLNALPDGVYEAQTLGTYKNGLTAKEGYYTRFRKTGTTWKLESETKVPAYDDTSLKTRMTAVETKMDNFSVTTDTEFNAESDNPIANSAVTPLADALEGFVGDSINIDTSIVNWSSNIYGMTNGIEASEFNKTLTIDVNNYYKLKYRGVKWNSITTSELNEYKTIVGIDVNNDKIVLLDSVNSSTIPSVIDVDIDISNIKTIYIIKKNINNTLPVISLESDKILKIKEFIELKTDDLNLILKSFLENNKHIINTVNNINYGYLKVDGTYNLSDTFSKLIKNINTSDFDTLHFKGYKGLVSTRNVANYCSIIGYKSDNSKVVLLGSHNGAIAQSITDVEIDVSNYIRIDIAYSNYEVAVGYNPEISLYNKNDIQIEADSVKKNTLSSFKEINLGYVDLSRNIYNKELILNSNFEFTIQNIGNFGNINVFKLKGGSISFIGNFDYASNSATYNPDVFNVIYIYNEYDVAKIYIEN